ncbi:RsmD family RNA methyltransferase [Lentisphaerota bacterium ZTH]|nr:RsmD family RNA methyltransferase [Lentisphaerota bacterium]WET05610.1 RsmD family RNA methyltransferase [Lentisphaerota bacterium ZTH]
MHIISGIARRIRLTVPKGMAVRPTSVRARKALFDSLGNFSNAEIADLFAGSGALGLEAASRGAARVLLVEQSSAHCRAINENIARITKAGVITDIKVVCQNVLSGSYFHLLPRPDAIFVDPPYPVSIKCFETLTSSVKFKKWAADALLIWEIPDSPGATGHFMNVPGLKTDLRKFGGTSFMIGSFDNTTTKV